MNLLQRIAVRGAKTGLMLSATTTAAIMLASAWENRAPWAALNCVAHIVDGDDKDQPTAFSPRESGLGVAVNTAAMGAWAVLYEGGLTVTGAKRTLTTASAAALIAYGIDYFVVPKRYTPGIEKRLSGRGIAFAYAVLAVTLALSGAWNTAKRD